MRESRSSARRTRLIGGLIGILLLALLGLAGASILVFPARLHPHLTEQELAGIRDPKDRVAAQDARRQRQNEARATPCKAWVPYWCYQPNRASTRKLASGPAA